MFNITILYTGKFMKFNISKEELILEPNTCIITGIFEESQLFPTTKKINTISNGYIDTLQKRNILHGTINETILLYDIPHIINQKILLIGCGQKNQFNAQHYRKTIYQTMQAIKNISAIKISFFLSEFNIIEYEIYWKIRQTIEIISNELYNFMEFKNKKNFPYHSLHEITIHISKNNKIDNYKTAIQDGLTISNNIKIAKDLSNMPPNICTPTYLTNKAKELSKDFPHIHVKIIDALEMETLGMAAYLAVGKGSSCHPPIMSIIKYQGIPKNYNTQPIVLIGKGLTFDSGGISIKQSEKMDEMKYDMCGAAVVYAVMRTVIELNLPLNVIGILATCENMISHTSLRPGDILTSLSGQTIEVLNTDAEGRLVLCDVLTYVERYNPKFVIDIATLTGACVIALGHHFTGLMSNDEKLSNALIQASKQSQDYVWQLPLHEKFHKQLKSTCADMTNVGGRDGSAITAGCFLSKFAHKYKWAHLDIAGTAWISNHQEKNATGRPVALLSQFLINITKNK